MHCILIVLCSLVWSNTPWEIAGQQALEKVNWNWRPEGWTIEFQPGKAGYLGMKYRDEKKVVIWVRPKQSPEDVASVIAHELAHVYSQLYINVKLQREWLKARGLPRTTRWSPPDVKEGKPEKSDYSYGEGDFAESVAWTLQGGKFSSRLRPAPNRTQQELILKWLRTLPEGRSE